jgi:hypothetical protein
MPGNVLPKPKMTHRRALPGLKTRPPLRDDAEYREALAELHGLGQAALECILDYEAKQACGPSAAAIPQAAATTHDGPDPSGRLA